MSSESDSVTYTGRVRWFNRKRGYGFIVVTDGEQSGQDVFVYHNQIHVSTEQYRYLVDGEYVSFEMTEQDDPENEGEQRYVAVNVRGVGGGELMCETRNAQFERRKEQQVHRRETDRSTGNNRNHRQTNYQSRMRQQQQSQGVRRQMRGSHRGRGGRVQQLAGRVVTRGNRSVLEIPL